MQENYSSRQNSTDLMTAGQTTSQALTEVDSNRRHFQATPSHTGHSHVVTEITRTILTYSQAVV